MTPLVLFTVAWVSGVLLAQAFAFPPVWLLLPLPAAVALLLAWPAAKWARRGAAMLIALALGVGRMRLAQTAVAPGPLTAYLDHADVTLVGVVSDEPDLSGVSARLRVKAEEVSLLGHPVETLTGRLLVYVPRYAEVGYGDRIQVTGTLQAPPVFDTFSYQEVLARQGIHAQLRSEQLTVLAHHQANLAREALLRFRARGYAMIKSLLPEPQGALLAGILLGIEYDLPPGLVKAFQRTGTSHIVAISGMNLVFIAGIVNQVARRCLRRRGSLVLSLVIVWGYVLLVGGSPAVLRAGVMSSIAMLALQEDRRLHGPTALAAAVLTLSMVNPFTFWDLGFQLSFAATAGLMVYVPLMTRWVARRLEGVLDEDRAERIVALISDTVIVTLATQLATAPIIARISQELSLVSLFANLLILPAQPFIMSLGGLALVFGFVFRPLGTLLGWFAWAFLWFTIIVVEWTAGFPWAAVEIGRVSAGWVWAYYALLALVTGWITRPRKLRLKIWAHVRSLDLRLMVGVAAVSILVGGYTVMQPDGKLHIAFLDVGHGDAVFMRMPSGNQALIDGGPDPRRTLTALGKRMPFWDRTLDWVILTSPDADRLGGLVQVLERYEVASVGIGPAPGRGVTYDAWSAALLAWANDDPEMPRTPKLLAAGVTYDLDAEVRLRVLWPPASRDGPAVLQLEHGDVRVLLLGDATSTVERQLPALHGQTLRSDVVQLARQGAATGTTAALLQAVSPEAAIVSRGGEDALSPYVLARLIDTPLYRTDQDGTIDLISDGTKITVRTAH